MNTENILLLLLIDAFKVASALESLSSVWQTPSHTLVLYIHINRNGHIKLHEKKRKGKAFANSSERPEATILPQLTLIMTYLVAFVL